MSDTCELKTMTQRGIQNCHKSAVYTTKAYGKRMKLCKRHLAGLMCRHLAVRCFCKGGK